MSIKETPYFDGKVKPHRIGVYRRKVSKYNDRTIFSMWDGRNWLYGSSSPEGAARQRMVSAYQRLPWCGLPEDLNAGGDGT